MEFKENTISAKILDPSEIEIISQNVNEDTFEEEFDIMESELIIIIQSSDDNEIYVTGAIGPLPDQTEN